MGTRIGKIEILFAIFVLITFLLVTGKYVAGAVVKEVAKNKKQYSFEVSRQESYWNYIINHSEYFPDSKLEFQDGRLGLFYSKEFNRNPITTFDAQSIPVLMLHGITESPKEGDITIKQFEELMMRLKKEGYHTISIKEFNEYTLGARKLDNKAILLTFDDGIKNSFYNADPVLQAFNYRAVMFAITGHSVKSQTSPYYLNELELKQMLISNRWDVQSHGDLDHFPEVINETGEKGSFMGQRLWLESEKRQETYAEFIARISRDLVYAKSKLEKLSGNTVIAYAFPFGDYGQYATDSAELKPQVMALAKSIYPLSFIQFRSERGTGYYRGAYKMNNDTGFFKRIPLDRTQTPAEVMALIMSAVPKELPFEFNNKTEAWIVESATDHVTVENGVRVRLEVAPGSDSAGTYLDGTHAWEDYSFSATFDPNNLAQFAVLGRSIDGNNYVACDYGYNKVSLKEYVSGQETLLGVTNNLYYQPYQGSKVNLRIDFKGGTAACYINNVIVAQTLALHPSLNHGGIGVKIWRLFEGEASARVSEIMAQ